VALRRLARYLRVIAACLALGLARPPLAPAAPPAGEIAWIAGARVAAAVAIEASNPKRAARKAPSTWSSARGNREPVTTVPAGARAIVIHLRLYLDHEALLC
jgi:hypothetical protein